MPLNHAPFFLQFWVALSILRDGLMCNPCTLVQFKHTFCFSHLFIKRSSRRVPNGSIWGSFLNPNVTFGAKKRGPKSGSKKGCPPESNYQLFPAREAPGAAASRARCSNKKQLFEQQLKHCSKFLQKQCGLSSKFLQKKKVVWTQNRCKKPDWTDESVQRK